MKTRYSLLILVCLLLSAAGALAANNRWSVEPHAYQYDMTAYVTLSGGAQLSGYEVAAFHDNECRGVAKLLTASDGTQVFQLRIYSNEAEGEEISFRVYNTAKGKELLAAETVTFHSQAMEGTPSEPLMLTVNDTLLGDVNGNSGIDIGDAVSIVNYLVGKESTTFVEDAADTNKNGQIDIGDAVIIVNYLVGKTESLSRQRVDDEIIPQ